ncbi:DUF1016 N-terminal domain-containing protein [Arthrobacter sp. A5]|uniref:DUF1016 N-terminal domain-containing protein n=1 Tax=Arthrobacter sp. A5 TaxID=576926 RepID=UPI003DA7CEB6
MPEWYPEFLVTVAARVTTVRARVVATVNQELVATYWAIGQDIVARQGEEGWGTKVIARLSGDLRSQFPSSRGFSPQNLRYMALRI